MLFYEDKTVTCLFRLNKSSSIAQRSLANHRRFPNSEIEQEIINDKKLLFPTLSFFKQDTILPNWFSSIVNIFSVFAIKHFSYFKNTQA